MIQAAIVAACFVIFKILDTIGCFSCTQDVPPEPIRG